MLDRVLSAFAIAQAILATLRAGSKVVTAQRKDRTATAAAALPSILPPLPNETSRLYDLTDAFRQGVKLGLKVDEYETDEFYTKVTAPAAAEKEPYSMALTPVIPNEAEVLLDQVKADVMKGAEDGELTNGEQVLSQHDEVGPTTCQLEDELLPMDLSDRLVTEYALDSTLVAKISAYAPNSFTRLRSYFGIQEQAFRQVLLESGPFVSFQSNSKGAARTGGVFFLTSDGAYLIKTIKRDEMRALLLMMPKYFEYMKENGRRSLLARFCGVYQVDLKLKPGEKQDDDRHYFIIMNSVFPNNAASLLSERFDLKGSTVGRKASDEERTKLGNQAVLKDLDLAHVEMAHGQGSGFAASNSLHIGADAKSVMLSQLEKDVALLQDCGVIDYSLLVGIAALATEDAAGEATTGGAAAAVRTKVAALRSKIRLALLKRNRYFGSYRCGVDAGQLAFLAGERNGLPAIYYFGLIDFLQPFDAKKVLEYRFKSMVHEKQTYSCVPPDLYARRLLAFVDKHIT